jgi:hypothetical protein
MTTYEQELHEDGLCAELVPVYTEDGVVSGRCKRPITDKVFMYRGYSDPIATPTQLPMCEGHAEEMVGWGAMSEAERLEWERHHDADH